MADRDRRRCCFVAASSEFCLAADPRYPDWPCTQAKVPEISLAAVWAGPPLDDVKDKWKDDAKVERAGAETGRKADSARGSRRRRSRNFSPARPPTRPRQAKLLFAGLFDTLNAQRSSVMNGLERVTRKQREAAEKIRADTLALQALQGASPPDQTKIDELGNQLVWQTRIFEDRRRVVKFVCEVPTAIDQRLFALGRMIQQEME